MAATRRASTPSESSNQTQSSSIHITSLHRRLYRYFSPVAFFAVFPLLVGLSARMVSKSPAAKTSDASCALPRSRYSRRRHAPRARASRRLGRLRTTTAPPAPAHAMMMMMMLMMLMPQSLQGKNLLFSLGNTTTSNVQTHFCSGRASRCSRCRRWRRQKRRRKRFRWGCCCCWRVCEYVRPETALRFVKRPKTGDEVPNGPRFPPLCFRVLKVF